jgi:hypothetical protein
LKKNHKKIIKKSKTLWITIVIHNAMIVGWIIVSPTTFNLC